MVKLDLVQLRDFINSLLVVHPVERYAVQNELKRSAVRGEFRLHQHLVCDLFYADFDPPVGGLRRLHRDIIEQWNIETLWASRAVLRRWCERRRLPIPAEIDLAKAEEITPIATEAIAEPEPSVVLSEDERFKDRMRTWRETEGRVPTRPEDYAWGAAQTPKIPQKRIDALRKKHRTDEEKSGGAPKKKPAQKIC
jgi:hypothetical protein